MELKVAYLISKKHNMREVARMLNINYTRVVYYKQRNKLVVTKKASNIPPFIISEVIRLYEIMTIAQLANFFGYSCSTIIRIINSEYVSPTKKYQAIMKHVNGEIVSEIAKDLNLTTYAVIGILREQENKTDELREKHRQSETTKTILKSYNITKEEVKEWLEKQKSKKKIVG